MVKVVGTSFTLDEGWKRSVCAGINYPRFTGEKEIYLPDSLEEKAPQFSDFARYEYNFSLEGQGRVVLEITDAHEGVENTVILLTVSHVI
jgi:hypothetical protein